MIGRRLVAWLLGAALAGSPVTAVASASPATEAPADAPAARSVDTPSAVEWPTERAAESVPSDAAEARAPEEGPAPADAKVEPPPPRPAAVRETIDVAVGLSPDAVGSPEEKALVTRLQASAKASIDPKTQVRRLRPGTGTGRQICRRRRDDLVILVGYVPQREEPVVLAHDCRLDRALDLRAVTSVDEPALIGVLWDEHDDLIRQGVRERRQRRPLGRKARVILAAGVALVVVGVAVGVLVASALREEKVVLKVGP